MKNTIATQTLGYAQLAYRSDFQIVAKRLRIVIPILGVSLATTLCSSIALFWLGIGDPAALKALLSINILGGLLLLASVYSMTGIYWNAYWMERAKRVEAEADVREMEQSIPCIVKGVLAEVPKLNSFSQKFGSDASQHRQVLEFVAEVANAEMVARALVDIAAPEPEVAESPSASEGYGSVESAY